jgi:hypothetical protein
VLAWALFSATCLLPPALFGDNANLIDAVDTDDLL